MEFTYCPDISALRGLVHALLEAEDMPMNLGPWDLLPGRRQALSILRFGSLPLTHRFTFQNTGPTSAYPGHYPRRWLFRQSCSRVACGLDTCLSYRPSMRAHRGVIPFHHSVLRCCRSVLSTGLDMSEHKASSKGFTHGDGVIAVSTFLVKPVILRWLG